MVPTLVTTSSESLMAALQRFDPDTMARAPAAALEHFLETSCALMLAQDASSIPPAPLSPTLMPPSNVKLSPADIEFIIRTTTSSQNAQSPPLPPKPSMEPPRLHARHCSDASSSRSSLDSRLESRSVSWASTSGNSSRTSLNLDHEKFHTERFLHAGPKRQSGPVRAQMPPRHALLVTKPRTMALLRPQKLSNAPEAQLRRSNAGAVFARLPKEILMMVLDELEQLHLAAEEGRKTCPTCYMRDLCSLSITNRKWSFSAKAKLYETIMLVGPDSVAHLKKKFKVKFGTRLILLRRTLRGNSILAGLVTTLRVPSYLEAEVTKKEREAYEDIVASVVMACPNLERLIGIRTFNYEFSRLCQALATRRRLSEHVWTVAGTTEQWPHSESSPDSKGETYLSAESMDLLCHHNRWANLASLAIHISLNGSFDPSLLLPIVRSLPSLQHLALSSISSLPESLFLNLPPLTSLYLGHLSSITTRSLTNLTRSSLRHSLKSLSLICLSSDALTLPLLARLMMSLNNLSHLTLICTSAPILPIGISIFLHPYLASSSLQYLHWDILPPFSSSTSASPFSSLSNISTHRPSTSSHATRPSTSSRQHRPSGSVSALTNPNDPTFLLAKAIQHAGFPALRRLRAPGDINGFLQRVCKPGTGWLIPHSARPPLGHGHTRSSSSSLIRLRKNSVSSSDNESIGSSLDEVIAGQTAWPAAIRTNLSAGSGFDVLPASCSLASAREAAQTRIEIARLRPRFRIIVEDWSLKERIRVTGRYEVGGYVGKVGSKIQYVLDGEDVGVEEKDVWGKRVCEGRWNVSDDGKSKRKDGHRAREKGYREETLEGLFWGR